MAIELTGVLQILSDYGLTYNDFSKLEPINSRHGSIQITSICPQSGLISSQNAVHWLLNIGAVTMLAGKPLTHEQEFLSAPSFDTSGKRTAGSDWIVRYQNLDNRWVRAKIYCTPWYPTNL